MIIAIAGNDGSGKSAIADELSKHFNNNHTVTRVPEFTGPLINLFKRKAKKESSSLEASPRKTSPIMPYLVWIDNIIGIILHKTVHRKSIVIMDRCMIDHLATWEELKLANNFINFLYLKLSPKPHITFYIKVDPQNALSRRIAQNDGRRPKSKEFYILKCKIYDSLITGLPIVTVDNNGSFSHSLKRIIKLSIIRNKLTHLKTIAISGLDGAGKTTTIVELSELLTQMNVKFRTIHFYYNYIIIKVLKCLKKPAIQSDENRNKKSIATEQKHVQKGKSKLWVTFVILDAKIQYYFMRLISKNHVILFDRFFPDYLVSFDFLGIKYDRVKLLNSFPKPDKYYLQIADYEVLYKRKPEHTLDFFKVCHGKYLLLAKESNMLLLDSTSKNKNDILEDLVGNL